MRADGHQRRRGRRCAGRQKAQLRRWQQHLAALLRVAHNEPPTNHLELAMDVQACRQLSHTPGQLKARKVCEGRRKSGHNLV